MCSANPPAGISTNPAARPGSTTSQSTAPTGDMSNVAGWNGAGDPVDSAGNVISGGQRINSAPVGVTPTYANSGGNVTKPLAVPNTGGPDLVAPTVPTTVSTGGPDFSVPRTPTYSGPTTGGPDLSVPQTPTGGLGPLYGGGPGPLGGGIDAGPQGAGLGVAPAPVTPIGGGVDAGPQGAGGAVAGKDLNVPQTPTGGLGIAATPTAQPTTYIPAGFGVQPTNSAGTVTNALMRRFQPTGWY